MGATHTTAKTCKCGCVATHRIWILPEGAEMFRRSTKVEFVGCDFCCSQQAKRNPGRYSHRKAI